MTSSAIRPVALLGVAFCILMMAVALGLEHIGGLAPCPLCVFQRVAVIAAGLVAWHYAVQLSRPLWGHGSDRGRR